MTQKSHVQCRGGKGSPKEGSQPEAGGKAVQLNLKVTPSFPQARLQLSRTQAKTEMADAELSGRRASSGCRTESQKLWVRTVLAVAGVPLKGPSPIKKMKREATKHTATMQIT